MGLIASELKFVATPEQGEVSALLIRPTEASHLLVLGHGASTNMRHATLQTIAERLAEVGVATFRYNFPYMEHGKGRDSQAVCTQTVRSAVAAAHKAASGLPLLTGGHSFGVAPRPCPRSGLLLLPLTHAGQARHETRRPSFRGHGADALPQRHARRAGGDGSAQTRVQKPRQACHASPARHGRSRLQDAQTLSQERGGRVRRDGSNRQGLGVPAEMTSPLMRIRGSRHDADPRSFSSRRTAGTLVSKAWKGRSFSLRSRTR
jgi:hypothetical protein